MGNSSIISGGERKAFMSFHYKSWSTSGLGGTKEKVGALPVGKDKAPFCRDLAENLRVEESGAQKKNKNSGE